MLNEQAYSAQMFTINPLIILGSIFLIWTFVHSIKAIFLDPLRDIPGPICARFSRLWYLRAVSRGGFEKENIQLHREHGVKLLLVLSSSVTSLELLMPSRAHNPDSSRTIQSR